MLWALVLILGDVFSGVHLQPSCFSGCICSGRSISCRDHQLHNFPSILDSDVEELDLSSNRITSMPYSIPHLGRLKVLNMSVNLIVTLRQNTFKDLESLQILDMSANKIRSLSEISSQDLLVWNRNLRAVNLSLNPLRILEPGLKSNLRTLDMSSCMIQALPENFLQDLPKIEDLNISRNPLRRLPILNSSTLRVLRVASCSGMRQLSDLTGLPSIQALDLSGSTQIHSVDLKSNSLIELNLRGCSLDEVEISGKQIKRLDLSNNMLTTLPGGFWIKVPEIEEVNLRSNQLTMVEVVNATMVDLSKNDLTDLPIRWSKVEVLNVSGNPLGALVVQVPNAKVLDASFCEILEVSEGLILSSSNLLHLNLSTNLLSSLPDIRSHTLQTLDLSSNRLESLPYIECKSLTYLNLVGNRLKWLANLSGFHQLTFELRDNPWTCACSDPAFSSLYLLAIHKADFSNLRCSTPANVSGLSWREACYEPNGSARMPSYLRDRPWLPLALSLSSMVIVLCILVLLKRKLDRIPASPPAPDPPPQQTRSSDNIQLPSYEEALLLPKLPRAPTMISVKTQTGDSPPLSPVSQHSV